MSSATVSNAAEDNAVCDTCGEPNRTGTSVIYVTERWCRSHALTYTDGLKMCIWCRHGVVRHRTNGITMPDYSDIKRRTERIAAIDEAGGYLNLYWHRLKSYFDSTGEGGQDD